MAGFYTNLTGGPFPDGARPLAEYQREGEIIERHRVDGGDPCSGLYWRVRFRTPLTARMAQSRHIVDNDAFRQLQYMSNALRLIFTGFPWCRMRTLFDDIVDII
jgi:hypothetical protein